VAAVGGRPGRLLAALALATLPFALLQAVVAPVLPQIQRALHASTSDVAWVVTAFLLSTCVATPIVGRLGDVHGKRRVLLAVLALVCVGQALAILAGSLAVLLLARVVQGVGGGIFPLTFGILRDELERERIPGAAGLLSAMLGIGGGLGVMLAGATLPHGGVRAIFVVPLALTAVAAAAVAAWVPARAPTARVRVGWGSAALLSAGLATVLIAISQTPRWGWASMRTLTVLAGGLAALAIWARAEALAREPLVDMRTMRIRAVLSTNVVAFLLGGGVFVAFVLIPRLAESPTAGFGASVGSAGLLLVPLMALTLVAGVLAGPIERRLGDRAALAAGCVAAAAAFALLLGAHASRGPVYVASGLLGVGTGLAYAAMPAIVVRAVPAGQTGAVSGVNTVARMAGGAVCADLAATFIASVPGEQGYARAFALALVLALLALGAAVSSAREARMGGREARGGGRARARASSPARAGAAAPGRSGRG
jgi:MFS family permease